MQSSRLVVALLLMAATEARADDLKLTELGITVSVPPEGGFSHQVISFAAGVDSPPQPIDLPPGWQHGAHFVKDGLDTNVFCVDVVGGQLNAITVRASNDGQVFCWGGNTPPGDGSKVGAFTPTQVRW